MNKQIEGNTTGTDEIDLIQLFRYFGRGFKSLFKSFLRIFLYFRKNIWRFGILVLVGIGIGYGLEQIVFTNQKTEVIVKPNADSKQYLYDVVAEIQANIDGRNESFFAKIGIDVKDVKDFSIRVESMEESAEDRDKDYLDYLAFLETLKDEEGVMEVVRAELLKNSTLNYKITFFYPAVESGTKTTQKLMDYINANAYYTELVAIRHANAKDKIQRNEELISQIDDLIDRYSRNLESREKPEATVFVSESEKMDIAGILNLKTTLIQEIEAKKVELLNQQQPIRIISFGNSQPVTKSFFGLAMVYFPLAFIGIFMLFDFFKFLYRKAEEWQML